MEHVSSGSLFCVLDIFGLSKYQTITHSTICSIPLDVIILLLKMFVYYIPESREYDMAQVPR